MELPAGTDPSVAWSPPDNWRVQSVVRSLRHKGVVRVFEQPYTCDSDRCTQSLGPEWKDMGTARAFVRYPFDTENGQW